jgi:hypothetical protein
MRLYLLAAALLCLGPALHAQGNLVRNGDMELGPEGDGRPDGWEAAGDAATVAQRLTGDAGFQSPRSARLDCTRFVQENPASHAMICQMGRFDIRNGEWYKLAFRARQKGLGGLPLMVALVNMNGWGGLGLGASVVPGTTWGRHELLFQATGDAVDTMRLQFCWLSTGTLWLDDVELSPTDASLNPTCVWPDAGGANLVPNGGFECGTDTWGSVGRYVTSGWAMPVNRLYGELVEGAAPEGRRCLKVTLSPATTPVCYFDCMAPVRTPVRTLLTGNLGWLPTIPGQTYCLSAYLRADRPGRPVKLVVQPFEQAPLERSITVGTAWQRYELSVTAPAAWCSVMLGPDLSQTDDPNCTLWLDAVQFQPGEAATAYAPRAAVEVGVASGRQGNVFFDGEEVALDVTVANRGRRPAVATLIVTDFSDACVARRHVTVLPAPQPVTQRVDLGLTRRGFYRVRLRVDGRQEPRSLRLAVIPRYTRPDSIFGMNHAYPWDHLLHEAVAAGLLWVRDWSLKWHDVQPAPGPFDFRETDYQIDRPRALGQPVLGLLPFPSDNWSSSAPASVAPGEGYPALGGRTSYAPRSDEEFSAYVKACVGHYRGRVKWYQVFNEPVYTNHALPAEHGYTGRDYGRLVKVFAAAARAADPGCKILAGIGGWPDGTRRYFREMFETGALDCIDAVDVHTYPGLAPPESQEEGLRVLRGLMQESGGAKPIWLTEHGYYADDDFTAQPVQRVQGWNAPLADERQQAAYSMRFNVILLAHGVERILYHAGTCNGLNTDNTEGTFFEYGGEPRKIYAAVAAFAELFPPGTKPLGELAWPEGSKAYLFQAGDRVVLAAWKSDDSSAKVGLAWTDRRISARDIMGNPLPGRELELSDAPVFLTARAGPGVAERLRHLSTWGEE